MENKLSLSDEDIKRLSNNSVNITNSNTYQKKFLDGEKQDSAIINLDNYGNGTHWTAVKPIKKNIIYYEDSFGVKSPFKTNKLIVYSPFKKQKDYEENCGARALNVLR